MDEFRQPDPNQALDALRVRQHKKQNNPQRELRMEKLRYLLMTGFSIKEAAKQMDVQYITARRYCADEDFQRQLKELSASIYEAVVEELKAGQQGIAQLVHSASERALATLLELMEDETQKGVVRMKCAQDLLDRHPDVPRGKHTEVDNKHTFINPLELVAAARAAKEIDAHPPSDSKLLEGHVGE